MTCKVKKSWANVEMEHAHNFPKNLQKSIAKKIACDHVKEMGTGYYPALKKMESGLVKKRKR
jgi:hypothetical protein